MFMLSSWYVDRENNSHDEWSIKQHILYSINLLAAYGSRENEDIKKTCIY